MPLFTKSLKIKSFSDKRIGRYLLYALGEIVLVVAGILIALQINNYNEERKQKKLVNDVLKSITYDLELDTLAVGYAIKNYEMRDSIAKAIIGDKYQREDFKKCAICPALTVTYVPLKINDKGYSSLKEIVDSSKEKDTLAIAIVQFYNAYDALLTQFGDEVKDITFENIREWRDNQPWFSVVTSGRKDERMLDYMESQEYKNRVAYYYTIVCRNYNTFLKAYKKDATEILQNINQRQQLDSIQKS